MFLKVLCALFGTNLVRFSEINILMTDTMSRFSRSRFVSFLECGRGRGIGQPGVNPVQLFATITCLYGVASETVPTFLMLSKNKIK